MTTRTPSCLASVRSSVPRLGGVLLAGAMLAGALLAGCPAQGALPDEPPGPEEFSRRWDLPQDFAAADDPLASWAGAAGVPDEEGPSDDDDAPDDGPGSEPSFDAPPPVGAPPSYMQGDCDGHDVLTLPATLGVTSWNDNMDSGTLFATNPGWYWLYDLFLSESGASQWNETASLRVSNPSNPSGRSLHSNCQDEWIVQDSDNNGLPALPRIYMGMFWLDAGANVVTLQHYCPMYRAGQCTGFHDASAFSTCDSNNPNSAHLDGEAVCAVRVDPPAR